VIRTRTRAVQVKPIGRLLANHCSRYVHRCAGRPFAPALVINAGGPWVEEVLSRRAGLNAKAKVRLVQGSHIVMRRLYGPRQSLYLQNQDMAIVFVIPYQNDFRSSAPPIAIMIGDPSQSKSLRKNCLFV